MKTTPRVVACLVAFLLVVVIWLGFAYLMRNTPYLPQILGWGLPGTLLAGFGLLALAADVL